MDHDHGLPSLEEKSWDLCLTDPPWNIDKGGLPSGKNTVESRKDSIHAYNDQITNYEVKMDILFSFIRKISNYMYLFSGYSNLGFWLYNYRKFDVGYLIWVRVNSGIRAFNAFFNRQEPIITWGKPNRKPSGDVINIHLKNGFLREGEYIHPHPKQYDLIKLLVDESLPTSVIDPYLGSGTTAEVCESLGIHWIGYEIMKEYAPDIEKRIARGIEKYKHRDNSKQVKLF